MSTPQLLEATDTHTIPRAPHWRWRAMHRRCSSVPRPSTPQRTKCDPCCCESVICEGRRRNASPCTEPTPLQAASRSQRRACHNQNGWKIRRTYGYLLDGLVVLAEGIRAILQGGQLRVLKDDERSKQAKTRVRLTIRAIHVVVLTGLGEAHLTAPF